jgi:hypothetical protein
LRFSSYLLLLPWFIALACKPMPSAPSSRLGGGGFNQQDLAKLSAAQVRVDLANPQQLFGMNVKASADFFTPAMIGSLKEAGVTWLRIELWWDQLQTYPNLFKELKLNGFNLLILLDYQLMNGAMGKPNAERSAANSAEMQEYVRTYEQRLSSALALLAEQSAFVDAFEIWNEADLVRSSGYDPGLHMETFADILKRSVQKIRSHDLFKHSRIVVGGFSKSNSEGLNKMKQAMSLVDKSQFDGMGLHTYGPIGTTAAIRQEIDQIVNQWHQAFSLPLWLTEIGTPSAGGNPANDPTREGNSEDRAAEYVTTVFDQIKKNHRRGDAPVAVAFYFSMRDDIGFADERFGLLRQDNSPKPSFAAFKQMTGSQALPYELKDPFGNILQPNVGTDETDAPVAQPQDPAPNPVSPQNPASPQPSDECSRIVATCQESGQWVQDCRQFNPQAVDRCAVWCLNEIGICKDLPLDQAMACADQKRSACGG